MSNIILIGFMGSGKTEVGRRLAQRLGYGFVDTDAMIEQSAGMRIAEIFASQGEAAFRKMERDLILRQLKALDKAVISTGGGMAIFNNNLPRLKKLGKMICLSARPEIILKRLDGQSDRPLINTPNPKEKIEMLLCRRREYYEQADFTVDTSELLADEVVQKILDWLAHKPVA